MSKRVKTRYAGVYYKIRKSEQTKREEKVYYVQFRTPDKKQHHEKVGTSSTGMTDARANQVRIQKLTGKILPNINRRQIEREKQQAKLNRWTIKRLWEEYSSVNSHLKRLRTDRGIFNNHLNIIFGNKIPEEIKPLEVDWLRNNLSKNLQPATVWGILELLKRLVNFGVGRNISSPFNFKIQMPKVNNEKTEMLTDEQIERLLSAIDEDPNRQCANLMRIALLTGFRRTELMKLRWDDIDFEKEFILIRDPKSGQTETHPLNAEVRMVLENHPKPFPENPYIFPNKEGGHRKECKHVTTRIRERAGLPKDFRPLHGLRHSFASGLANDGQDLYSIQKLLRHKDARTTQRYAHLHNEALKRASNRAANIFKPKAKKE